MPVTFVAAGAAAPQASPGPDWCACPLVNPMLTKWWMDDKEQKRLKGPGCGIDAHQPTGPFDWNGWAGSGRVEQPEARPAAERPPPTPVKWPFEPPMTKKNGGKRNNVSNKVAMFGPEWPVEPYKKPTGTALTSRKIRPGECDGELPDSRLDFTRTKRRIIGSQKADLYRRDRRSGRDAPQGNPCKDLPVERVATPDLPDPEELRWGSRGGPRWYDAAGAFQGRVDRHLPIENSGPGPFPKGKLIAPETSMDGWERDLHTTSDMRWFPPTEQPLRPLGALPTEAAMKSGMARPPPGTLGTLEAAPHPPASRKAPSELGLDPWGTRKLDQRPGNSRRSRTAGGMSGPLGATACEPSRPPPSRDSRKGLSRAGSAPSGLFDLGATQPDRPQTGQSQRTDASDVTLHTWYKSRLKPQNSTWYLRSLHKDEIRTRKVPNPNKDAIFRTPGLTGFAGRDLPDGQDRHRETVRPASTA